MRQAVAVVLLMGVALVGGCGASAQVRFQDEGWLEATSQNFVVQGDLGPKRMREVTLECERSYSIVKSAIGLGMREPPGPTQVIALSSKTQFAFVTGKDVRGVYFSPHPLTPVPRDTIVMPFIGDGYDRSTLQHELVHRFLDWNLLGIPTWVDEGLADFLESARSHGSSVLVGEPSLYQRRVQGRWMVGRFPLAQMVLNPEATRAQISEDFSDAGLTAYTGAWVLVHVLLNGKPEFRTAFEGFLQDLREGHGRDAFSQRFPEHLLAQVDAAYWAFLSREQTPVHEVPWNYERSSDVRLRAMTPLEVNIEIAWLEPFTVPLAQTERIIQLAPAKADGYLLRALALMRSGEASFEPDLAQALQNAPSDRLALLFQLAVLLGKKRPTSEIDAIAHRFEVVARYEVDQLALAVWEGESKRYDAALKRLERAKVTYPRSYASDCPAGIVHEKQGDSIKTTESFRRCAARAPDWFRKNALKALKRQLPR